MYNKELCLEEFIIMDDSVNRHGTHRMGSGLAENKVL